MIESESGVAGHGVFERKGLDVSPGDEAVFDGPEPAESPFAEEAVEGDIDVNDDHAAFDFEQVDVVDDFGAAAVHVEDGLAHQMLVQQHPAGMIDEGGILVRLRAAGRRWRRRRS